MSESRVIGPWTAGAELGRGGNAIVYEATRPELPDPAALKVLTSTRADKESYRRFVQEVEFLRSVWPRRGTRCLARVRRPRRRWGGRRIHRRRVEA